MFQAKTNLSKLVEAIENGTESEIVLARNGKPVARLVPLEPKKRGKRLVLAKERFVVPDHIDRDNDLMLEHFNGKGKSGAEEA